MDASGRAGVQAAPFETAERLFRVDEGSGEPDDVVFLEGDEEAVYVYLDFADINPASVPKAGSEVTLKDMDTDAPEIALPGGATLRGAWEESLGSSLFFTQAPLPHAAPAAPRPAHPAWQPQHQGPRYHCHTERRLRFSALAPAPAPPGSPSQVPAGSPRPAPDPPQARLGSAAPAQAAGQHAGQAAAQGQPAAHAVPAAPQGALAAVAQAPAGAAAAPAVPPASAAAAATPGSGSTLTPALPCAGPMSTGERAQAERAAGSGLGHAGPARQAGVVEGNTQAPARDQDAHGAGAGGFASAVGPARGCKTLAPSMGPGGEAGGAEPMAEDSA